MYLENTQRKAIIPDMNRIKVMSWNVLYKEKADNILSLIKKFDPDILCCQEITINSHINSGRDIPQELGNIIGNYTYRQTLPDLYGHPTSMGNAIFSKFPIVKDRWAFVRRAGSSINILSQDRIYLEVNLKINNQLLIVGTTHLSFIPWFIESPARNKEADRLIQEISSNKNKFILAGDLNSTPSSNTIKKLEKRLKSAGPEHTENSFSTKPFALAGFEVWGLDWRLDYVFTTRDIKVISSKIVKTKYSDHLPIIAEIEI